MQFGGRKARNRFLESELVRLEREATQAAKDRIIARREAAKSAPAAAPAELIQNNRYLN
jgi:hypothetical protein